MAPNKKRKVIDTAWVEQRIVAHIPEEIIASSAPLSAAIQEWRQNEQILPSLAASSLSPEQVYEIFEIQQDGDSDYTVAQDDLIEIPQELKSMFEKFKNVVWKNHKKNEALSRCYVNMLVFVSILDEKALLQRSEFKSTATSSSPGPSVSPTTPARSFDESKPTAIGLYFETELRQNVVFNGKQYILSGLADYTLGHEQRGSGADNLIVVEAKRRYDIGNSYGQLLAYMAMVHRARKKESKSNAVVFGVATDGFDYRFWRIDNRSKVASSVLYEWTRKSHQPYIYSLFRSIIRAAILSTPTTSPVKSEDLGQLFHDEDAQSSFDFGAMKKWRDLFTTEDDPDVELIELPWTTEPSKLP